MLNSQSINAFALPTGQLYVTRGLLALANDKSELASVLAHEMGHVVARHAAIREEQARQAALVEPRRHRRDQRSGNRRAGACQIEARAGELLARAGIRSRRHRRRRSPRAPATTPTAPCASSPRWSTIPSSGRSRTAPHRSARPGFPVVASGDAGAHQRTRSPMRASSTPAALGAVDATRPPISPASTASSFGEDPSEGFVRGRRFLHPRLGFTFTAPEGFTLDNTAQAVLGVKHGGGQALRLDVVRVPAEQTLAEYLTSGWIENVDPGSCRGGHHQRLSRPPPRPPRAINGTSGSTPSASAATSIASSSPRSTAAPKPTAPSANRSAPSAA